MIMRQQIFPLTIPMLLLFAISCQNEKGFYRPPITELQPDTVIDSWRDSVFMGLAYELYSDEENLYISDFQLNRILALNHDLSLAHMWGREGKGPGEFLGAAHGLILPQGGIAVLDYNNKRINHFTPEGRFVKAVVLPETLGGSIAGGWSMDSQGQYYFSSTHPGGKILKLDPQGKVLATWSDKVEGPFNQCYHLNITEQGDLLASQVSMFMLEKYRLDGTLIETLDLRDHPQFDRYKRYVEADPDLQDPERAKAYTTIHISEAKYLDGKLFVLVADAEEDKIGTNQGAYIKQILEFDVYPELRYRRHYVLAMPEKYVSSFTVLPDGKTLIAASRQERLYRYRLE